MTTTTSSSPQGEENFIEQFHERLRALASEESVKIIRCIASHKPTPVPVHVIAQELGAKRSVTSKYLARLRNSRLVRLEGRRKGGYSLNTGELEAVIGPENRKRITQDLQGKEK